MNEQTKVSKVLFLAPLVPERSEFEVPAFWRTVEAAIADDYRDDARFARAAK